MPEFRHSAISRISAIIQSASSMDQQRQELERLARAALKELGAQVTAVHASPAANQPGVWEIDFGGPRPLRLKYGEGSSAQWVRDQIFDQYLAR
jgi:hypothetical protein